MIDPTETPTPPEDDLLDIELGDTAEVPVPLPPPAPPSAEVLDVTLDDADETYPVVSEFPAVTEQQAALGKPGVTVPCVCSATRQCFDVRFEEYEPGVFSATETAKTPVKEAKGGGPCGMGSVAGTFRMGPDYRCPHCGDGALTICEACNAVLCLGATDKSGDCPCPACTAILSPTGESATAAPTRGKGKGKPGQAW